MKGIVILGFARGVKTYSPGDEISVNHKIFNELEKEGYVKRKISVRNSQNKKSIGPSENK